MFVVKPTELHWQFPWATPCSANVPQNCKVKLLYLREKVKARVGFFYVKESSWLQFLLQNMSRSNTMNLSRQNTDHTVYRPCSLFFLVLVCALTFDSLFFGSSYKIVCNIFKFVIYPPAAEGQYLTFDSITDSIDA